MKFIGKKTQLFALNFDLKKKTEIVKFWKIDKWYLYGKCPYFSKKKMWGHCWITEGGLSQTLKMCQIRGGSENKI